MNWPLTNADIQNSVRQRMSAAYCFFTGIQESTGRAGMNALRTA
jgi:hypothetical protein